MQQEELDWGEGHRASNDHAGRQPALAGEVIFASAEEQSQRCSELLGAGALLITLPPPALEVRGALGELLEELVERELARVGAPSPYLAAWSAMPEDAQARLADQLFRARTVGRTGIAIAMGSLRAVAAPALTSDDSATLRWLAETTEDAPLVLLVDDADVRLLGHAAPLPLGVLLATRRPMWSEAPSDAIDVTFDDAADEEIGSSTIAEAYDAPPDSAPRELAGDDATTNDTCVAFVDDAGADGEPGDAPIDVDLAEAALTQADLVSAAPADAGAHAHESASADDAAVDATAGADAPARDATAVDAPARDATAVDATADDAPAGDGVTGDDAPTHAAADGVTGDDDAPARDAGRARTRAAARERRPPRRADASVGVPVSGPSDAWRSWAIALSGARGAQPLAAFERLFADSYVPLANAIAGGLDDPRALRAYDEFRRSFERSYADAFATFGATNRRPRLVMDAYDLASKQARLSSARAAHVLVVDSMRFDLGCLVRDALVRETAGAATLTSEALLWSALPTTTMRQLETFARGLDALRAPAREEPAESLRGRAAEAVRRLRVGSRELYKLDLVPALLEATPDVVGSLEAIAAQTAEAIARHVSTLPPRTLLLLVGDHGFGVDRRGQVRAGGASPEEVLVPATSWLIGDLH